jgi:hypothetical protein
MAVLRPRFKIEGFWKHQRTRNCLPLRSVGQYYQHDVAPNELRVSLVKIVVGVVLLLLGLLAAWSGARFTSDNLTSRTRSLDMTGPNAGNSDQQLLACMAAQMAVKRLAQTIEGSFPSCSGVRVRGSGPHFKVMSFFDLADSSGIIRRRNYAVEVNHRTDGQWQTSVVHMD